MVQSSGISIQHSSEMKMPCLIFLCQSNSPILLVPLKPCSLLSLALPQGALKMDWKSPDIYVGLLLHCCTEHLQDMALLAWFGGDISTEEAAYLLGIGSRTAGSKLRVRDTVLSGLYVLGFTDCCLCGIQCC